jgi:hypothetical protein
MPAKKILLPFDPGANYFDYLHISSIDCDSLRFTLEVNERHRSFYFKVYNNGYELRNCRRGLDLADLQPRFLHRVSVYGQDYEVEIFNMNVFRLNHLTAKKVYLVQMQVEFKRWEAVSCFCSYNKAVRDRLERLALFFFDATTEEEFRNVFGWDKSEIEDLENGERFMRQISDKAGELEDFARSYMDLGVYRIEPVYVEE